MSSELNVVYHVHAVSLESIQIFMSRGVFSGFKSVFIVGFGFGIGVVCWLNSFIGVVSVEMSFPSHSFDDAFNVFD